VKKTDLLVLEDSNREAIARKVCSSLGKGNICIIPTDTIYGIVALEHFEDSLRRIYAIKNRPVKKPFIRLIGSLEALRFYTHQHLPESLKKYWPGPLTIIFRGLHEKTVAIRFPDDPFLKELFLLLGEIGLGDRGLVAPSANRSGGEDIFNCNSLIDTFSRLVDIIVCLKDGLKNRRASTIIDITGPEWKIVREGEVKIH